MYKHVTCGNWAIIVHGNHKFEFVSCLFKKMVMNYKFRLVTAMHRNGPLSQVLFECVKCFVFRFQEDHCAESGVIIDKCIPVAIS